MNPLKDDPYRAMPAAAVLESERPFVRRRRWLRLAGAVVAVAAGPMGIVIYTACVGYDWLGTAEEGREAQGLLRSLPFQIVHDRPWVLTEDRPRPIVSATVTLEQSLGWRDAEGWCHAAMDLAPRLKVVADGASITLMSWPWGKQDLVLLAQLMDTWARKLHAGHGIKSVDVRWAERRGPPLSMV